MDNIHFFNISKENPEPLFDSFYQKGVLVIPDSIEKTNELTQKNARLIELISAFDVLFEMQKENGDEVKKIVSQVVDILEKTENINYSAFSQFFMVYNSNYSMFQKIKDKEGFVFEMLKKYCKERHKIYLSHGYSNSILQVMSDNYSHKRNSKTGIVKIETILKPYKIKRCELGMNQKSDFYILPDKGDSMLFDLFLLNNQIEMQSRATEHNKRPDFVIKIKEDYFIMELKAMKENGGGQDKQIVEVANFIRYSEKDTHIHYVTFLDGAYANLIFSGDAPKIQSQRKDIEELLKKNKQNYFVNTSGFKALIKYLFGEEQ